MPTPGRAVFYAAMLGAYNSEKVIRVNVQTVNGFCHIIGYLHSPL